MSEKKLCGKTADRRLKHIHDWFDKLFLPNAEYYTSDKKPCNCEFIDNNIINWLLNDA